MQEVACWCSGVTFVYTYGSLGSRGASVIDDHSFVPGILDVLNLGFGRSCFRSLHFEGSEKEDSSVHLLL